MMTVPRDNVVVLDQLEGRTADNSLIDSIKINGILNPLKVYRYTFEGPPPLGVPTRAYVVLDGHRRLDAADQLEIEELPIEIMDKPENDTEARTIQVILNRNRKDVKPTHVAGAIMAMKARGKQQKNIAKRFGLSEPEVSMYLTLFRGHEKLQKAVDSGRVSLSAIEPLLTKDLSVQEELADAAIRQRTVRAVRALVKTHQMSTDITAPTSQLEENIDPLEFLALEELREARDILNRLNKTQIKSETIFTEMVKVYQEIKAEVRQLENKRKG
ncbi:MAG: ParB/RepB/Spo0J family partition protein [Candidatus Thorarchaeota archaeon]|jgi:ParB family chromosome partitioning protein